MAVSTNDSADPRVDHYLHPAVVVKVFDHRTGKEQLWHAYG